MEALVYGAMNPDLVHVVDRVPSPGDDLRSRSWSLRWGGKAANAAVALAHWGVTTRLLGLVIGADALGDVLLDTLDRPRLDRSWIERDAAESTRHCVILVTPDGDRTIVCAGYEGARWQDVPGAAWSHSAVVLVDGFGGAAAARVVAEAQGRGVPVVWLDAPTTTVGPAVVVWSRHEHSVAEAEALAGRGVDVVLTAGAAPVTAWWGGARLVAEPPVVTARDATGAGDIFAAAVAFGIVSGWPADRILRHAAAAGASSAAAERSDPPTLAGIAALLDG